MADETSPTTDCFVCAKHADAALMPGGPVYADGRVVVSHPSPRAPEQSGTVRLGHLPVEPRGRCARRRVPNTSTRR